MLSHITKQISAVFRLCSPSEIAVNEIMGTERDSCFLGVPHIMYMSKSRVDGSCLPAFHLTMVVLAPSENWIKEQGNCPGFHFTGSRETAIIQKIT